MTDAAAILPIPPMPKYWMGESVVFDRSKLSYSYGEGEKIGKIHSIEIHIAESSRDFDTGGKRGEWQVLYYTEHDDPVPEDMVLGPVTVGKKR